MSRSDHPTHDTPDTWLHSEHPIAARVCRPALDFMHVESASGVVLLVAAIVAVVWANIPSSIVGYSDFWHTHLTLHIGPLHFDESLKHLVNDGLMALFFFVVGLEIKRELFTGQLRDPQTAALPAFAAVGGMVIPAGVFLLFNAGTDAAAGWAVPMATDIAFSLGILALLGSRVPSGARLFLLTLAVVDDIGAIAVIAVFYSDSIHAGWLVTGMGMLIAIGVASRLRVRSHVFYFPVAVITWFAFLESGVHATIAGVLIGLLTPVSPLYTVKDFDRRARRILDTYPDDARIEDLEHEALMLSHLAREAVSPLRRAEHSLHLWSAFAVIPIFALANAGVSFEGISLGDVVQSKVAIGVALGLVVGKIVGIAGFAFLGETIGLGKRPEFVSWKAVVGLASLAGVGFTVALFVVELAFPAGAIADQAKIGIFGGSIVAGVLGWWMLSRTYPKRSSKRMADDGAAAAWHDASPAATPPSS